MIIIEKKIPLIWMTIHTLLQNINCTVITINATDLKNLVIYYACYLSATIFCVKLVFISLY